MINKIMASVIIWFFVSSQSFSAINLSSVQDGISAYKNKDYSKAFEILSYHADRYEHEAQFYLGKIYFTGNGAKQDYSKAVYWLEEAAIHGHLQSIYNLGVIFYKGIGVKRNFETSLDYFIKASLEGQPKAIYNIGLMYQLGQGVKKDSVTAAKYFIAAAEIGDKFAQNNLGLLFKNGEGVNSSYVDAYKWLILSEKDGYQLAKNNKREVENWMTIKQIEQAKLKAEQWKPKVFINSVHSSDESELNPNEKSKKRLRNLYRVISSQPAFYKKGTGTGFVINPDGYVLTNAHVVDECKLVKYLVNGQEIKLNLIKIDKVNDLAILRATQKLSKNVAQFQINNAISPGEDVYALGYPLQNVLSNEAIFTNGIINAINGPNGNSDYFQFSAPVQPGNSGGPLLNTGGNIIGIVTASLPFHSQGVAQNINFAIKNSSIKQFLDGAKIKYHTGLAVSKLSKKGIFIKSSSFTSKIICLGKFYGN